MKFVREPLFHFLLLGAGLFALFAIVNDSQEEPLDRIVVTAPEVERLAQEFAKTWQRLPTRDELDALIEARVREEIYYREARAMGLDREDPIIRQRLREKLEFLTDDMAAASEPSEDELRDYFVEHIEVFEPSPRVSFDHVFFNRDVRGDTARGDAESLLARLEESASGVDPSTLGDPLTLASVFNGTTLERVGRRFGAVFAESLAAAPVGTWSGPVESGFGLHLVRVRERETAPAPEFESVRDEVEREWRAARRAEAEERFFEGLRERYKIVIEMVDS